MNELKQDVLDAVVGRLKFTRASLRSTETQLAANLRVIAKQVETQEELRDRIRVLEQFLVDNGVDVKETK